MGANEIVANTVTGSTGCGGGMMTDSCAVRIENNIIRGNASKTHGGGIEVVDPPSHGTGQAVVNNSIYGNSSGVGSGLAVGYEARVAVFNDIFWANSAPVGAPIICIHDKGTATVSYCNVEFGYVGEGNIYLDPMFVDGDYLFHLQSNSPCVGVGRDSIRMGQLCYYASASDFDGRVRPMPAGTPVDLGAQEEQITVGFGMKAVNLPTHFALAQNYPNPFNPTTVISYQLPVTSDVRLVVYDILGREVELLVTERKPPGTYQVEFSARGRSSGVYLCRLTARGTGSGSAGLFEQTRRLVLLK